ncbi:MAG: hypothetical protein PHY93_08560 [Bacteriovorax sp.]|nr:hypothetical protein [Bacteriovorax sp.]
MKANQTEEHEGMTIYKLLRLNAPDLKPGLYYRYLPLKDDRTLYHWPDVVSAEKIKECEDGILKDLDDDDYEDGYYFDYQDYNSF